ncbi:hypothetical protein LWC34_43285 [Kibdelosporangium philippinense]|uniref:Uncharacterized protein n=1 Tax=Kibdelosporangium philippinense TaxID=211113 RepID=A0ABS8ZT22_9PSEU|nr:hypothetical protein [Kibdelosporangium philippinense]MCE7009588.1 hypothetical protein [Kibdelosporangium philippinense]
MRSVEDAVPLARSLLGQSIPSVEELFEAVRAYAQLEFAADDDGFLLQYCAGSWNDPPVFEAGFTRQFDDDKGLLQIDLMYGYAVDAELKSLCGNGEWWFRGYGVPFDSWLSSARDHEIWEVLRTRSPTGFAVSQDRPGC